MKVIEDLELLIERYQKMGIEEENLALDYTAQKRYEIAQYHHGRARGFFDAQILLIASTI